MKKFIVCTVVFFGFVRNSFAQNVTLTSIMRSEYVFGNDNLVSDKPVDQTDVFISFENGTWIDIWGSVPLNVQNIGKDYATELYPTGGWSGKVGDYKLSIGVGYDDLYRTGKFEKTDFFISTVEISRDFQVLKYLTVSPFLHVETNFTFDGSVNGDTLPRLGSYCSWKINDGISLDSKIYVLYDPGVLSNQVALVCNLESALHWKINKNVSLELPYIRFTGPLTSVSDGRRQHLVFGSGISIKF